MENVIISEKVKKKMHQRLFLENAWKLYNNSEMIMSDPRKSFATVTIGNGLAYFGSGWLQNPAIGSYIRWWKTEELPAIDSDGNLVWFISGSPLSGMNACMAVTPDGESKRISQRTSFSDIWQSFKNINLQFKEKMNEVNPYTFEDVLVVLNGESYEQVINDTKDELLFLSRLYDHTEGYDSARIIKSSQRTTLQRLSKPIMEFLEDYTLVEKGMYKLKEEYENKLARLKKTYPDRGDEFYIQQSVEMYPYLASLRVLVSMVEPFMDDIFGRNPNKLDFIDVLRWARREKELEEKRKDR